MAYLPSFAGSGTLKLEPDSTKHSSASLSSQKVFIIIIIILFLLYTIKATELTYSFHADFLLYMGFLSFSFEFFFCFVLSVI